MKLCDETITLFHACVDPETGGNAWTPTTVSGASWYMTDTSTVDTGKGGLVAANKVIVRIPAEAAPDGLVLSNGDIVVKGDASGVENPTPAKLKKLYGADCATVLGITDNTRNRARTAGASASRTAHGMAPNAPHWRITGT